MTTSEIKMGIPIVTTCVACLFCLPASASMLELAAERDAIFSPGQITLAGRLVNASCFIDGYEIRMGLYVDGTLIRERVAAPDPNGEVELNVPFPLVRSRTEGRCRAELRLAGQFLEAREIPIEVWSKAEPVSLSECPTDVWVLDASGRLHEVFSGLGVDVSDAAFQGIRDFAVPSVVFVGENSDAAALERILDRVRSANSNCVLVILRQTAFPASLNVSVVAEPRWSRPLSADAEAGLLSGMAPRDVAALVAQSRPVVVETADARKVTSVLTVPSEDEDSVTTFLAVARDQSRVTTVLCQLPVVDSRDPRQVSLLYNLIRFTGDATNGDGMRGRPAERDAK